MFTILCVFLIMSLSIALPASIIMLGVKGLNGLTDDFHSWREWKKSKE